MSIPIITSIIPMTPITMPITVNSKSVTTHNHSPSTGSNSFSGPSKPHLGHVIIAPRETRPPGIFIPALYSIGFKPQVGLLKISPHFGW